MFQSVTTINTYVNECWVMLSLHRTQHAVC